MSQLFDMLTGTSAFNNFIIVCIMIAGINVGISTYCPTTGGSSMCRGISLLDDVILYIFTFECTAKIVAEGAAPIIYFTGKEWAWNNFDFVIVMVCYDAIGEPLNLTSQVALLRLVRLLRVAKIVRKIPQLQVIVMGLIGGIKSIVYIVILLIIVFYIYGIAGVYAFRDNDPWHFGTLLTAMLTLFRCSTLEDWTDVMYINIYGCRRYPGGIYRQLDDLPVTFGPHDKAVDTISYFYPSRHEPMDLKGTDYPCGDGYSEPGKLVSWYSNGSIEKRCIGHEKGLHKATTDTTKWFCTNPKPNPYVAVSYFITFIVVSALVMLSLFVGAVTMSMTSSMNQMKEEADKASRSKRMKRGSRKFVSLIGGVKSTEEESKMSIRDRQEQIKQKRIMSMLSDALNGKDLSKYNSADDEASTGSIFRDDDTILLRMLKIYSKLALKCQRIANSSVFGDFITIVILVAGVIVGMQTDMKIVRYLGESLVYLDYVILGIFCAELVIKFVAEEFRPFNYFESNWNKFDFIVVFGSLLSLGNDNAPTGLLTMLRLLRLLRVLKLVKSLPQLQVIVTALIMGLNSIFYIAIILFMFFYMFGILGMVLFQENDPWHFGTLHITLVTLFRCSTLEDWTDVMYINIYGCDMYGYQDSLAPGVGVGCKHPRRTVLTVLYFLVFQVIGALVLLTLFIGVVTTAMEEATRDQKKALTVEQRVKVVKDEMNLSQQLIDLYREVFTTLDLDSGGKIEADEIYTGLKLVGTEIPKDLLYDLFDEVDVDRGGEIDFSEFIMFMFLLQKARASKCEEVISGFEVEPPGLAMPTGETEHMFARDKEKIEAKSDDLEEDKNHHGNEVQGVTVSSLTE